MDHTLSETDTISETKARTLEGDRSGAYSNGLVCKHARVRKAIARPRMKTCSRGWWRAAAGVLHEDPAQPRGWAIILHLNIDDAAISAVLHTAHVTRASRFGTAADSAQ